MPSFTFVSTANAVVARRWDAGVRGRHERHVLPERGARGSGDHHQDKGDRARSLAGVGVEMDALTDLAARRGLIVVEDAAQGIRSEVNGRPVGEYRRAGRSQLPRDEERGLRRRRRASSTIERFVERAEIVHEKGTDRQRFYQGAVDKYTWVDVGSSYALSDLAAAYLWAQLEHVDEITAMRLAIWEGYHAALAELEARGELRRPIVPSACRHNAHMYYVIVDDLATRTALLRELAEQGVNAVFHYSPLHASEAGRRYGHAGGDLDVTTFVGDRLLRLPLWAGMSEAHVARVVAAVQRFFEGR